jgi:hypothetical protein
MWLCEATTPQRGKAGDILTAVDTEPETCGAESEVDDSESRMEGIKYNRKPLKHKARVGGQGSQSECKSLDHCLHV